jgi:hypothetical protein
LHHRASRARRIPQETLAPLKYENYPNIPGYTHFIAEVVKGGSATLSFIQSCSSAEEAKKNIGELKISIIKIPVLGTVKIDFSEEENSRFENVRISYSSAMVENMPSLKDTHRVASKMLMKLAKQLNTLSYKLLPLSVSDSSACLQPQALLSLSEWQVSTKQMEWDERRNLPVLATSC